MLSNTIAQKDQLFIYQGQPYTTLGTVDIFATADARVESKTIPSRVSCAIKILCGMLVYLANSIHNIHTCALYDGDDHLACLMK